MRIVMLCLLVILGVTKVGQEDTMYFGAWKQGFATLLEDGFLSTVHTTFTFIIFFNVIFSSSSFTFNISLSGWTTTNQTLISILLNFNPQVSRKTRLRQSKRKIRMSLIPTTVNNKNNNKEDPMTVVRLNERNKKYPI